MAYEYRANLESRVVDRRMCGTAIISVRARRELGGRFKRDALVSRPGRRSSLAAARPAPPPGGGRSRVENGTESETEGRTFYTPYPNSTNDFMLSFSCKIENKKFAIIQQ